MKNKTLKIATRQSPLALCQANYIKAAIQKHHPDITIELMPMTTAGDQNQDQNLNAIGGKGLFIKELEQALLDKTADIAVHSMKDVPMELPAGLIIPVMTQRADPRDALVSDYYEHLSDLPSYSVVGTSSLRRTCQLRALRPDLTLKSMRGNVDTRLKKLMNDEYSAIILAAAGLLRLGLKDRIKTFLPIDDFLPAVGQGALGIECRLDDSAIIDLIRPLQHQETYYCVQAERAMNKALQGSCQVPIAGYAVFEGKKLFLRGKVGKPEGDLILHASGTGDPEQADALGQQIAEALLQQGAREILDALK